MLILSREIRLINNDKLESFDQDMGESSRHKKDIKY